jgi:hypothetical protein
MRAYLRIYAYTHVLRGYVRVHANFCSDDSLTSGVGGG